MFRKTPLTLLVSVTIATILLAPTAVFAQFPGPPPMGPGGPPPIAAGGPPAFAGPPPKGPGGELRAGLGGPAPRLGAGAYAGYAYGSSNDGSYSDSDCYYAYSRHRRVLVCPTNTAVDIVSAWASLVLVIETGSFTAVA
jgi:hypothetical protein